MNKLLKFTALLETATGVTVLALPHIAVRLLFAADVSSAGVLMTRFAGICLIALGVACWTGRATVQQLSGMLTYNVLVVLYFAYVGIRGQAVGLLLWPAVVVHAVISVLLVRARSKEERTPAA